MPMPSCLHTDIHTCINIQYKHTIHIIITPGIERALNQIRLKYPDRLASASVEEQVYIYICTSIHILHICMHTHIFMHEYAHMYIEKQWQILFVCMYTSPMALVV